MMTILNQARALIERLSRELQARRDSSDDTTLQFANRCIRFGSTP